MTAQAFANLASPGCPPVTYCRCGAHTQHMLYRILWNSPGITLKTAALELKLPYPNVKRYASRLRRKGLANRCPECFLDSMFRLQCHNCGADFSEKGFTPESVSADSSSPVYSLQAGGGLGGKVNYNGLRLQYGALNISHLVDVAEDPRFERLKSRLWQGVKSQMPRDDVCEDAVSMLKRDYLEAIRAYPGIERWSGFGDAIIGRVWNRLRMLYPALPTELPPSLTSKKRSQGPHALQPDILGKEFESQ